MFEDISKGMVDQIEVEITGRAVLLPVGMVALVEAEIPGRAVLLLVGVAALLAETTEMTEEALVEAEIPGRAVLLLVVVVALLAETTEVAEEAFRQRENLRKLWWLDDRTLQRGRTESLVAQVKDGVQTAMMVRPIRAVIVSFRLPTLCCAFVSIRTLGCFFLASSRGDSEPVPTPAHRYPSSSHAPRIAQQPVAAPGPSTSVPQINCLCGKPSVERTAGRENENKGRRFRRCRQPASEDCKFFEWIDEPAQDGNAKLNRPPNPPLFPRRGPAQMMPYVFHMVSSMLTRTLKDFS